MERKECANGLELIKVAAIKLRGHFSEVFIGALAMTTPLILCLFIGILMSILFGSAWVFTIGLILFVIFLAPLQMGYIKYFNNALDGKQPRLREVYSYIRFSTLTLRAIYISGILLLMYIFGGIAFIMPAGFAISAFSMVIFFLQKYEHPKLRGAMSDCAKKMVGNRLAMFSYKLIFYLVYGMLMVVAGLCLMLVYTLLLDSLLVSWIVAMCSAIVFIFLYTFVTVYYHSSNQIFFEDVLSRDEKKKQRKIQTTTNNTHQVGDDEEQKASEEKLVEEKKEDVVKPKKESSKKATKTSTKTTKTKSTKTTKEKTQK